MAGTRDSKAAMQARLEATGLYRLQQGDLVLGELAAYAAGLDWLWQQLEVLEQECFIATAQEDGLLLREQAAGALPGEEADTQTRRDMLLAMGTIQRKDIDLQSVGKALRGMWGRGAAGRVDGRIFTSDGNPDAVPIYVARAGQEADESISAGRHNYGFYFSG